MTATIINATDDRILATDNGAVRIRDIKYADYSLLEQEVVRVRIDGKQGLETISGFNALMFVYALTPTWLEGKTYVKWKGNSWVVHNLIAHPLMQLLAFCKCYKLAMKVHDRTVPQPIGFK